MATAELIRVVRFVVHTRPDLDELTALYLLIRYGGERYLGLDETEITFDNTGGQLPEGETAESRLTIYGELAVGTRGGRYDEHERGNPNRKLSSATRLVADDLGLTERPELEALIAYVDFVDSHGEQAAPGQSNPTDILFNVKTAVDTMNEEGVDPDTVVEWVFTYFDAHVSRQERFCAALADEVKNALTYEFTQGGRVKTLVVLETDNRQAARAARMAGHSAMVVRQPDGHVQLMIRRGDGLTLRDVACVLRLEEAHIKGIELLEHHSYIDLKQLDQVPEVPEWYYYRPGDQLLNGSEKAPDRPVTSIPPDRLVTLVLRCLDETLWPANRMAQCSAGHCTHSRQDPCPWAGMGLRRCYELQRQS